MDCASRRSSDEQEKAAKKCVVVPGRSSRRADNQGAYQLPAIKARVRCSCTRCAATRKNLQHDPDQKWDQIIGAQEKVMRPSKEMERQACVQEAEHNGNKSGYPKTAHHEQGSKAGQRKGQKEVQIEGHSGVWV